MNQLYVYIHPLPIEPASRLPPSHASRSTQRTQLSSPYYTEASQQASTLHTVVNICHCYSLSSSHPLLPPLCPQASSLSLCLYSCPANRFISTVFLESIYNICTNTWYLIFSFWLASLCIQQTQGSTVSLQMTQYSLWLKLPKQLENRAPISILVSSSNPLDQRFWQSFHKNSCNLQWPFLLFHQPSLGH